jgi:hypothetical protein
MLVYYNSIHGSLIFAIYVVIFFGWLNDTLVKLSVDKMIYTLNMYWQKILQESYNKNLRQLKSTYHKILRFCVECNSQQLMSSPDINSNGIGCSQS